MSAILKSATWRLLAGSYYVSGLHRLRHRGRVVILTYHRVVSDEMVHDECIQPGMFVLAHSFEAHIAYLRKRFDIISLDELLDLWRTNRLKKDGFYCVITFDDGWRDNYQFAFPVLMKHRVPATIFLATDFIGTARWFWPDQIMLLLVKAREHTTAEADRQAFSTVLRETIGITMSAAEGVFRKVDSGDPINPDDIIEYLKEVEGDRIHQIIDRLSRALHMEFPRQRVLLNWDEVREMAGKGVSFGSHSCSHRIMTKIPVSEVKTELIDSRQALLQQGLKPVPVFCYPNGNFNQQVKALVRECGYDAALGSGVGLEDDRPDDLFALKRIGLHEDSTASVPLLTLALSGFR